MTDVGGVYASDGADAVDTDMHSLEGFGNIFAEVYDGGFDGCIFGRHSHRGAFVYFKFRRDDAVDGGNIDNVAVALVLEVHSGLLAGQKHAA